MMKLKGIELKCENSRARDDEFSGKWFINKVLAKVYMEKVGRRRALRYTNKRKRLFDARER